MPILLLRLALRWGWWGSTLSRTVSLDDLDTWYCSCWKRIEIQKSGQPRRQPTKRWKAFRSCFYQRYGVHCAGCDWRSWSLCGVNALEDVAEARRSVLGEARSTARPWMTKLGAAPIWTCLGQPADSLEILLKNGRGSRWNALDIFGPS